MNITICNVNINCRWLFSIAALVVYQRPTDRFSKQLSGEFWGQQDSCYGPIGWLQQSGRHHSFPLFSMTPTPAGFSVWGHVAEREQHVSWSVDEADEPRSIPPKGLKRMKNDGTRSWNITWKMLTSSLIFIDLCGEKIIWLMVWNMLTLFFLSVGKGIIIPTDEL